MFQAENVEGGTTAAQCREASDKGHDATGFPFSQLGFDLALDQYFLTMSPMLSFGIVFCDIACLMYGICLLILKRG